MRIAFIHNEKKINTGAHYINNLISQKLKASGVEVKNFFPNISLDAPNHLLGLKNILFFFSLLEKRKEVFKFDLIQGTTYTPLPFLTYDIPTVCHFGSTNYGFLKFTPQAINLEDGPKNFWYQLRKEGAIKELNIKTRKPIRDIMEIERYVAKRAEAAIATSKIVADELLHMGVLKERIHLIHNCIEDYWFNTKFKFNKNPKIVFLGRIGNDAFNLKLKGFDRLIHVYNHFKNIQKVTICITTNKNLSNWILNNIENHSLFVNHKKNKIPEILSNISGSILFLSSRYEGFSLSLIEGMSQGLIPVSYGVGVAPEIIKNGINGFIVNSQEEAIEKIKILLEDEKLRKFCSKNSYKTSKEFNSDKNTKLLISLYKKIIKQNYALK